MRLTENIKYLRQLRGLKQSDIADRLNKTKSAISNWETGLNLPNPDEVEQLCRILDVTPNQIFGWDPIPDLEDYLEKQRVKSERTAQLTEQRKRIRDELKQIGDELRNMRG